jgi:hypothetical protein
LAIGSVAVAAFFWSRPVAGKSQSGLRCVAQYSRRVAKVFGGSGT